MSHSSPIGSQVRLQQASQPRSLHHPVNITVSPPRRIAQTTTSPDLQEVEELQLQLHHLTDALKVKQNVTVQTDILASTQRHELDKLRERLRLLDVQRDAEAQRSRTVELRLKEKVQSYDTVLQQLAEEEAILKATHGQRKKTHKDCLKTQHEHRVGLRTAIASSEVSQKHASCILDVADASNATLAIQRRERGQERTRRDSHERTEDQQEFDTMYREVHRLRTLSHQAELQYAESQLRLAQSRLHATHDGLNQSSDYLDQKHLECENATKEILGITTIQQHLRSLTAKGDALEAVGAQQQAEINTQLAAKDAHARQLAMGESDLERERESDARIKELVGAVDSMREKLVVCRERRGNNRQHFRANNDRAGEMRNEIERSNQQLHSDTMHLNTLVASRNNELEMLATQVNQTAVRLQDAETRLEEANARYHASAVLIEQAREKDRQVREMTQRSALELQRAVSSA